MELIDLEKEGLRELILREFNGDVKNDKVYFSKRLKKSSFEQYKEVLKKALSKGTSKTLSEDISKNVLLNPTLVRQTKKGLITAKMPFDAPLTLAEGEFNRYYIRGVCLKAIEENKKVIVYRARFSSNPRSESEAKINLEIDPKKLLEDLRKNIGLETHLRLPQPNSGLSVKIKS